MHHSLHDAYAQQAASVTDGHLGVMRGAIILSYYRNGVLKKTSATSPVCCKNREPRAVDFLSPYVRS